MCDTKICSTCNSEKPLNEFYKRKTYKDGYNTNCKLCVKIYNKEYSKRDKYNGLSEEDIDFIKNQKRKYSRDWAKEKWKIDPTNFKIANKTWRDNNPDKNRNRKLKSKYGITSDDYNKLFNEQEGKCKTCGRHQNEFKIKLCVDHNHETGNIRGLLCTDCNIALGKIKENIKTLKNLIKLIEDDKNSNWVVK
jgi:hypothetical protein